MITQYSATKIVPPQIPHILPRPRLLERLNRDQGKKLNFILGQAAQGKTTLGVSYVQSSELPSAWINLGPEDSDAVNFYYSLVWSLERVLKDIDFSFALNYPSLTFGPREEIYLYRDWVLAILDAVTVPAQVIFDGLDRLAADAPAFQFLQVLLDHAPPHLRLFFLAREMPGLEIQALKLKHEANVLTNEDLLFTWEECKLFIKDIKGLSVKHQVAKRMFGLTEGWIGGLVLLCEALARVPELSREDFLADKLSGKFRSEVCQFFDESVFSSRPEDIQDFLIKSAILDIVEPDFIKEFTGLPGAQEILEALTQSNIFVQSSYHEKKGWQFRYHQLFRNFLLRKFHTRIDQETQRALYQRAGALSAQRGAWEEAVSFYLQAAAYAEAARVLEKIGLELLKVGRVADLSQWLGALPENIVQSKPWLLYIRFMIKRFSLSEEHVADNLRCYDLFQQSGDVRGILLSLANLIESCMYRNINLPLDSLLARGEELQRSLTIDQYPYERAALWLQMGFSYALRESGLWKGFRTCQKAYLIAKELGDLPLQLFALIYAYFSLGTLGEYDKAEELRQEVEKSIAAFPSPELRTIHLLYSVKLILQRGDIEQADIVLKEAFDEIQNHGLIYLSWSGYHDLVSIKIFKESYHEAEEVAKQFLEVTFTSGNKWLYGMGLLTLGWCYYHIGDFLKAREWLVRSEEEYYHVGILQQNIRKMLLGLTSCHLQRADQNTEKQLQEALENYTETNNPYYLVQAHFAMAIFKSYQGETDEAIPHLQTAFTTARKKNFSLFFHINKNDLVKLCVLGLELEIPEAMDYAAHLLADHLSAHAGPDLVRLSQHANPRVARKALEVRQAIHRAGLPRLRLQTLGGFRLWRGEEEVEEKEWEGRQPRLLLKALLARGATQVHRDLLIEDLWPETSPDAGKQKFKINLHRLRKTLEPCPDKTFGSSYLHLQANLLSLDLELCEIDVLGFLSFCQEGISQEKQGLIREALAAYEEAMSRYTGEFLAYEPYAPWAAKPRDQMHQAYCDLLARMTELLEKQGALVKATDIGQKLIQADPLREDAYRRLMLLQAGRGRYSEALRTYDECRRALKQELDVEPDELTTAIYRKILESSKASDTKSPS